MFFYEKTSVGPEKRFTSMDLIQCAEKMIREKKQQEINLTKSYNYGWLRSKQLKQDISSPKEINHLIPMILKMTPESCAAIAVKLDSLTENSNVKLSDMLSIFQKLLEERDSMQAINQSVRLKKERKFNRVQPELLPPRQPTVSFIV